METEIAKGDDATSIATLGYLATYQVGQQSAE
jgi:hypothetical protein